MTENHQELAHGRSGAAGESAVAVPALAPAEASDDERARAIMARMVARHGAPSLADYRRTYDSAGLEWPGDEEIRHRHPVNDGPDQQRGAADPAA